MKIIIEPKKITHKNFKKFGELISTIKTKPININNGYAKRFNNLCKINTSNKKGSTIMSIFSNKSRTLVNVVGLPLILFIIFQGGILFNSFIYLVSILY